MRNAPLIQEKVVWWWHGKCVITHATQHGESWRTSVALDLEIHRNKERLRVAPLEQRFFFIENVCSMSTGISQSATFGNHFWIVL